LKNKSKIKTASNYITSDYLGLKKTNEEVKLPTVENFVELINMANENKISSRTAKNILAIIVITNESPMKIAKEKNLLQNDNEEELTKIIQEIIKANPEIVKIYKGGKENALMSLVGQIMKKTKGSANPIITQKLLKKLLV